MFETFTTLVILSLLYLVFFRPGKTPPLDNPLVIERPGQYHMTLAPKLNLAQPFIEAVGKQFGASTDSSKYSTTQYFEVNDKEITSHGHDAYLLAITLRNGMLYFQAASPQDDGRNRLFTIREFADGVLARFPATGEHDTVMDERIVAAVQKTAQSRSTQVKHLPQ